MSQVGQITTDTAAPEILKDFEDPFFGPHTRPSQPTEMRNDPPQQQGELENTNNTFDELQEVDRQIENIELKLKLNVLKEKRQAIFKKKHQELLQRSSTQPQNLLSDCFVSQDNQNPGAFGGSLDLVSGRAGRGGMISDNSQTSDVFVSTLFKRV
jgi:hypothetical protein